MRTHTRAAIFHCSAETKKKDPVKTPHIEKWIFLWDESGFEKAPNNGEHNVLMMASVGPNKAHKLPARKERK